MTTETQDNLTVYEKYYDEYCNTKLPDGKLIGPELGFTRLMVLLADNNSSYRAAALVALVTLRGSKVANLVVPRLNDCAVSVRVAACMQIAVLGLRSAVPMLYDSLNDRQPYVVIAAARALMVFGDTGGFDSVVRSVIKKGVHQMEALSCLNLFLDEKLPLTDDGLKSAIKMFSETSKTHLFTIH